MARVENKNELPGGQLVADLDAPDETEGCEQELPPEALAQLQIGLVVGDGATPRIVQLKHDRVGDHDERLEGDDRLGQVQDAFSAAVAVQAEVDTAVGPLKHPSAVPNQSFVFLTSFI